MRAEGCGSRARAAERTSNMEPMFVTLDVLKLTGWLKAAAFCRVESRACDTGARCANQELAAASASGAHAEDPTGGLGQCGCVAHAAERTANIQFMSVTRDVSKLTGWLKAAASCRVERRACDSGARCANRKARELGRGAAASANAARTRRTRGWRAVEAGHAEASARGTLSAYS